MPSLRKLISMERIIRVGKIQLLLTDLTQISTSFDSPRISCATTSSPLGSAVALLSGTPEQRLAVCYRRFSSGNEKDCPVTVLG